MNVIPSQPSEPSTPTFEPNDKEQQVLRHLLAEDFAGFVKGWETAFDDTAAAKDYVAISADELQKDYERNEVAGDKKYLGKHLGLRGTVAEIKRSIGQNYFVHLKGGSNQFVQPLAKMAYGYVDFLAELEKGQSIALVCEGGGMLMGSAVAADCVPADVWVEGMVAAKMRDLPKLVGSDKFTTTMLIMSVVLAERLKETSACLSRDTKLDDDNCRKDFSQILEEPKGKKGKVEPTLSEATKARLKTIPGAEPYLQELADKGG